MKIVFMGTPDFAATGLEKLIHSNHEIIAVYTQPDRRGGRGNKLLSSAVKQLSLVHGLQVYQPEKIKDINVLPQLQELNPDVIVVIAYGQILPKEILELPRYGCLNVHASILPKYRGAAPIHWAILNGDEVTGVTVMQMDAGMDTGDILATAEENISPADTTSTLYERLKIAGADLLLDTLTNLESGEIKPCRQDSAKATYTGLITRDLEKIELSQSAEKAHNKVRALNSAFIWDEYGQPLKILRTQVVSMNKNYPVGQVVIIDKLGFVLATGQDGLKVLEVQPANRKRMSAVDYVNGTRLKVNYRFN